MGVTVRPVLGEMRISDLGVIDETAIELHPGLTVFTGETGAGKTMVVTGLSLLGGGRADATRVRGGASRAVVEGRFELPAGGPAEVVLADAGAERDSDGSVIALRTVGSDGRSRAHIGGRSVPVGVLAELAEQLLAVHGQNDQLRLLRPAEQRKMLDRFTGEPAAAPLAAYRETRQQWLAATAELTERTERSRELAREADLLRHGLTEIAEVDPKPGEDVELVAEARRLSDVDQLREAASGAQYAVSGAADGDPDAPGALGMLADARRRLAGTDDPRLRALEPRLAEAAVLVADAGTELGGYLDALEADPARLEQVLARQSELKALTRKYAADVDGVLAWAEDAERRLAGLDTSEETIAELTRRRDELAKCLAGLAGELTVARQAAAEELAKAVTTELGGLAMPQAAIEVSVRQRQVDPGDPTALTIGRTTYHAGPDGVDDVELRLRPHAGANGMPINKGASGGELSRVMLALEVVLAHSDPVPTLVFDEVDAGVGGRAAVEVGRRLALLARSHQVIVVTHLAQVAAFADSHLVVDKGIDRQGIDRQGDKGGKDTEGITRSDVRVLSDSERVVELARMLAGMDSTDTGRAHAEELLAAAARDKETDARKAGRKSTAGSKSNGGKSRSSNAT